MNEPKERRSLRWGEEQVKRHDEELRALVDTTAARLARLEALDAEFDVFDPAYRLTLREARRNLTEHQTFLLKAEGAK